MSTQLTREVSNQTCLPAAYEKKQSVLQVGAGWWRAGEGKKKVDFPSFKLAERGKGKNVTDRCSLQHFLRAHSCS